MSAGAATLSHVDAANHQRDYVFGMWGAFVQNLKEGESGDMAEGERERR